MKLTYLLLSTLCIVSAYASDTIHPLFWEREFTIDITNTASNNSGKLIPSTQFIAKSQDFQTIQSDPNLVYPPHRILFNFGESCRSSNTTIDTLRQLSYNSIEATSIKTFEKFALVKRGSCNWSEKIAVVKDLSTNLQLNVTAVLIYDNDTHNGTVSIEKTFASGSGSVSPGNYATDLPPARNILNMLDNDLLTIPSASSTTAYFIPFNYGESFIQKINASYDPNSPQIRNFTLVTPYLNEVSWPPSYNDSFFTASRGYLSYIIALAAIFLIGLIFLRWWKIRRMRADYPNGFNGFTTANGFNMQPRNNQLDPLPVDIVNSLPIDKYEEDIVKNTNCAICLEDFAPGKSDIRILPCGHGFCVLCIDPWLTQKSTACPICKWDCLPVDLRRERNAQREREREARNNNSHIIHMPFTPSPELQSTENTSSIPLTTVYPPPQTSLPQATSSQASSSQAYAPQESLPQGLLPRTSLSRDITEINESQNSVEINVTTSQDNGEPSQPNPVLSDISSEKKSPPKN